MPISTVSQAIARRIAPLFSQKNETPFHVRQCLGSAISVLVRCVPDTQRLNVIVLPSIEDAQCVKADLEVLSGIAQSALVALLPPSLIKPYDAQQVQDLHALVNRTEVMQQVSTGEIRWLVTSAAAIFDKLPNQESLTQASKLLNRGDHCEPAALVGFLNDSEYLQVNFVENPGEYARRGGILDVFPYNSEYPVRIEFFGDEIDSLREFDVSTQRSVSFLDAVRLVPHLGKTAEVTDLLSALPTDARLFLVQADMIQAELASAFAKAKQLHGGKENLPLPSDLFVDDEAFSASIRNFERIYLGGHPEKTEAVQTIDLGTSPQPDFNGSVKLLREHLKQTTENGTETIILCDNEGQRDRFEELLGSPGDPFRYRLSMDRLWKGFRLESEQLALYTDHQIFNRYYRPAVKKARRGGISQKELRDLHIGDYVVHVDFGIGRFEGFKTIKVREISQESVVLRYAEDSLMYVNVHSLHKLQKYSGKEGGEPQVTKLGTGEWARKKAKTKSRLKDIARELIILYAKRKAQPAFAFAEDTAWQTEMEASFMYEETPDQMSAIEAVKADMEKSMPMDRLVCGDVGFGKTEIAVRAAFKAVMNQKQVAVLVPTTILADQHGKTFRNRMQDFPVQVEVLSRFRSTGEIKDVLKRVKEGKVDILVGTHRLVSKDVVFKDLGLLIIDEEQRFGVGTKEKLKEWRYSVDVLTLSATPIPRTLQLSLMGARDLSVITTPPPNRQPVYTEIHSFDPFMIRDAILRETSRGGQAFFIHNRVQNIEQVAAMIREIVPDIRVRYAHGQMTGPELEKIITDFYQHKYDVLISTNIVENGIDIPNANTIIINRADRFGLSELHQLRGRVGRSNRKAFCYLVTPPLGELSQDARRRLMALEEFSDLGSGFHIAMRDLDIRGAGDILGAEQSGFINEIGIELYTKILNETVQELKETEFKDLFKDLPVTIALPDTQVDMDLSAQLPKKYISDDVERLNLYRTIAGADAVATLDQIREELHDRFGPLPQDAHHLLTGAAIRIEAAQLQFIKVTIRAGKMWLQCPNADTSTDYYKGGQFQQLMSVLEDVAAKRFSLVQKENAVRVVIDKIPDIEAALSFVSELKLHLAAYEPA